MSVASPESLSIERVAGWRRAPAASLLAGAVLLAGSLAVNPGPGVLHVADPRWFAGHLLTAAAYLLLLLGLPALGGDQLGRTGRLGLAGLMVHFAVSSGSQLYYARVVPILAASPGLGAQLGPDGSLASLYGSWRTGITLFAAVALTALAYGLWRSRPRRTLAAAGLLVAAVGEVTITPIAIVAFVVVLGWSGLRLLRTAGVR